MAGNGWRLARSRGSATAQLPLAICGVLAVVIVLLGKAEASLFDSARARISDWASPALAELRTPLSVFENWIGSIGTVFSVYDENMALKRENAELRKWQNVALSLERRMQRYELLLSAVPDAEIPSLTARVIGESSRPFIRTMLLNAGNAQGVRKGQAVIDDRGFIGRVYLTGERTSWVILLSDLNSRVPVRIVSSNRRAIMAGDNSPAPILELDVGDEPIKAGDRVVSTGDGGLLPPDLPIGVVIESGRSLRVALFADPDASDYVHVLDYRLPADPPANPTEGGLPTVLPPEPEETGVTSPAADTPAPKIVPRAGQTAVPPLNPTAQRPAPAIAGPNPPPDRRAQNTSGNVASVAPVLRDR